MLGQAGISVRRQRLDFGQRGRRRPAPAQGIVELAFHTNVLGQVAATTKRLTAGYERASVYRCARRVRTQNMPTCWKFFAVLAVMFCLNAGMLLPAAAEVSTRELAAQSRPRITIHPRRIHPAPTVKRYCPPGVEKESGVSGRVIVPQMPCGWE